MTTVSTAAPAATSTLSVTRWSQLIFVIVCMVMIANLQYGWTLFVNPINKATGWSIASIQFAYSMFIALETWLTPIQGWIVDILGPRRGPKIMVAFGGFMVAVGWIINSTADSLTMLYIGAIVSGTGGGIEQGLQVMAGSALRCDQRAVGAVRQLGPICRISGECRKGGAEDTEQKLHPSHPAKLRCSRPMSPDCGLPEGVTLQAGKTCHGSHPFVINYSKARFPAPKRPTRRSQLVALRTAAGGAEPIAVPM